MFTPTSNPELDDLLSTMRNKIFLPSHLSKSQQDLIYLDKHQRMLTIEPVFATIQGEKFQLEHIDRVKDVPSGKGGLMNAMELMREEKDWDNLPSILIGLKDAKRKITTVNWTQITRKAGSAGRPDVILECARRVSDTSFKLAAPELVAEVMWQLQNRAFNSDWAAKETKQALAWAEMVSELLEDKRHAGGKVVDPKQDVRVRPEVIGVLLQLSAVWATRYYDGEDRDGKVAQYTARLLGSPAGVQLDPESVDLHTSNLYLTHMTPVLQGMKLAQPILGQGSGLEKLTAELEAAIASQRERLLSRGLRSHDGGPLRGIQVYDELLGPEAKKVVSTARRHKTPQQTETEVAE